MTRQRRQPSVRQKRLRFLAKINLDYAGFIGGTIGLLLIASFFVFLNKTDASVAKFYPMVCLGGWQNPSYAQGEPSLSQEALPDLFTDINSAVLLDSISQIFCGNFSGDIPSGRVVKEMRLSFSLVVKPKEETDEATLPASDQSTEPLIESSSQIELTSEAKDINLSDQTVVSSTPLPVEPMVPMVPEVLVTPAPSVEETSEETSPILALPLSVEPIVPEVLVTPAPPVEETSPILALSLSIDAEIELEESSVVEDVSAEDLSAVAPAEKILVEEVLAPVAAEFPVAPISEELLPKEEPQPKEETTTPGSETILSLDSVQVSTTSVSDTTSLPEPGSFLTISYTLDGVSWHEISKLPATVSPNIVIDLPLTSWEDISRLQVSIANQPILDQAPVVFFDGLTLEVMYDDNETTATNIKEEHKAEELEADNNHDITFDREANHSCSIKPFQITVPEDSSVTVAVALTRGNPGSQAVLKPATLPDGLAIEFSKSKIDTLSGIDFESIETLEIKRQFGSQVGSFNIPIIFGEQTGESSEFSYTYCLMNVVAPERVYDEEIEL